jgi:hypothetical protein
MRPARFFLALLFGAAVLITFLKLLFFALIFGAVAGGIYFIARGIQYSMMARQQVPYGPMPGYPQQPIQSLGGGHYAPASPMPGLSRQIEVL